VKDPEKHKYPTRQNPGRFCNHCRCCTQFSTPGVRCTPSRERAPLAWSERKAVRLNKRRGKYYTTI